MTADAKMQPVSGSPGEGLSRADVSWQVASRRVARLQRIQLLTILSLAVVVVVSAFFMGTLYVASSAQHEEREHENLELVEVRDQVRSLQVVVLRRELAGDTVFTPERVLEVGAMATRVEEIAGKARPRESGAERDARLAVNRLVDRYRDEYAAAASPQSAG